jgi:hypothetical protein
MQSYEFKTPGSSQPPVGGHALAPSVTNVATAIVALKPGAFAFAGKTVTAATLPGIVLGGKLVSFTLMNAGPENVIFTGSDSNAVSLGTGNYSWSAESDANTENGFTVDATAVSGGIESCIIIYNYR